MPAEPNHKMDDLLRAYAQKRRDQAGPPFQISPATRAMLQEEVEATFRQPYAPRPRTTDFAVASFWPRFLLAGAGVAVLLIAAGIWLKIEDAEEARLARARESNLFLFAESAGSRLPGIMPAEESERLEVAAAPMPSPAMEDLYSNAPRYQYGLPAQTSARGAARPEMAAGRSAVVNVADARSAVADAKLGDFVVEPRLQLQAEVPETALQFGRTPTTVAMRAEGSSAPLGLEQRVDELPERTIDTASASRPQPASGPIPSASAEPEAAAKATAPVMISAAGVANNYYFEQVTPQTRYRRNLNSPPMPKVLTSFEVQQAGNNLRIVDADKSVYEGTIDAVPKTVPPSSQDSWNFRAMGTNRTLNELVVFTGNFETATEAVESDRAYDGVTVMQDTSSQLEARAKDVGGGVGGGGIGRSSVSNASQNLLRIQGNAIVGRDNQIRIEAQQVSP